MSSQGVILSCPFLPLKLLWYAKPSCSKKEYYKGWFTYYLIDLFSFRRVSGRGSLKKKPFLSTKNWLNKKKFEIWIQNGKKIIKLHNVGSYPTTKLFNVHGYQKEYKENVLIAVKTYRHVHHVHKFYAESLKRSFVPRCQTERTIETVHWHLFHCGRPSPDLWFDCPSNDIEYIEGSKYALEKWNDQIYVTCRPTFLLTEMNELLPTDLE